MIQFTLNTRVQHHVKFFPLFLPQRDTRILIFHNGDVIGNDKVPQSPLIGCIKDEH